MNASLHACRRCGLSADDYRQTNNDDLRSALMHETRATIDGFLDPRPPDFAKPSSARGTSATLRSRSNSTFSHDPSGADSFLTRLLGQRNSDMALSNLDAAGVKGRSSGLKEATNNIERSDT